MTNSAEEMVTISRVEYDRLREGNAQMKQMREELARLTRVNEWLQEQIKLAKQNRFGSKADTSSAEYEQLGLFDEAETTQWLEERTEKQEIPVAAHTRTHKTGALKDIVPENIPVEVEEHFLEGEDLLCDICGSEMEIIGKEVRRTLKIIPAQVLVHEDWYYSYACKSCCIENGDTIVAKTPRDASVLSGSFASPEAIAHIMTQKYVLGVPLYRQEQDLSRKEIQLSRQTMSNWMIKSAERWLQPLYDELHRRLLREEILHADETELQVLHEPGKKAQSTSYMWLYRTGKHAEHPIVLYEYQPNRKQENPAGFLTGFKGYLQTDGYSGYNSVPDVIHVGCLAHLRRKFTDAEKAAPKGTKCTTAVTAVAYCNAIFALEKQWADRTPDERLQIRREKVLPLLDEFGTWAQTRNASAKSKLGVALVYLKNQLPKIYNYLLDGRLECSNNLAERSIKPFVIDRKNFLFANTPGGARSSAVTFSLIETAKESGLDPFRYLTYVFRTAPRLDRSKPDWILPLLPQNAPAECRVDLRP